MFRVVDFPQPEGPTRMMNSPSAHGEVEVVDGQGPVGIALDDVVQNDFCHEVAPSVMVVGLSP